ncbi:MAG: hypothetical protein FJW35_09665 [Acidobacteria bacterium]|nr:hypothetical protein [Acidobacteriota bacterium]
MDIGGDRITAAELSRIDRRITINARPQMVWRALADAGPVLGHFHPGQHDLGFGQVIGHVRVHSWAAVACHEHVALEIAVKDFRRRAHAIEPVEGVEPL